MSGDAVTALQNALVKAGAEIDVDGKFGPQTLVAVITFQTANGLDPNGVVGPLTMAALGGSTKMIPVISTSLTPWMDIMRTWIGNSELTGAKATDFDKMVFSHTDDTEVADTGKMAPGCAATACAALELSGYSSTHNAAAISFATYGTSRELTHGCVVVFGGSRALTPGVITSRSWIRSMAMRRSRASEETNQARCASAIFLSMMRLRSVGR